MEDANPVAESETEELETSVEPQQDAETATEGGNTGSTEDATPGKEGEGETAAAAPPQPNQNNLIINYLPSHVTEIELRNMFAVHGDLAHVKVVYDRTTGKSMGYGFVKFTTNEAAAAATNAINGMAIDRKRIKVSVARPSSKEIKNSKLYVTNLPDHFSQDNVIEVFQQYGKIIECRTLVDPKTTISRCTAFVQFDTRREAKDALKFMNGHSLPGSKKGLLVKFAEDHHRRMQRQEQQGQNAKRGGGDGNHMGGNQYGHQGHQHPGKGKGGRKGKGGGGRGGGAGGMYRGTQGMGGRHGHPPHMGPGYLNPAMGLPASPDGSPMAQTMLQRYGMQLPPGGPAAAAAAQQAAAYNAAQVAHNTYGMMQLNNAMSMMNVAGGNVPGARGDGAGAAAGDGGVGAVGGVGAGGAFGVPPPPSGIGGGRSSMMRGGAAEHVHPPPPPAVMPPHVLSPTGYGSAGAGIGYVNEMKNASNLSANLSGGGGPVTPVKHQQPQASGERGSLEQQQQQQQQANNHGQPFVLRGV